MNIKYGCVFFDDPYEHTNGFASIEGRTAKRIRGTMDLDSDIIWISNIDAPYMISAGFASHTRFRASNFLRNTIVKISDFIGVDQENPSDLAKTMSLVMSNTMAITAAMTDTDKKFTPEAQLKKNIRACLWPPDSALPEFAMKSLTNATSYWIPAERSISFDVNLSQKKIFQIPPRKILKCLQGMPVPAGTKWENIPRSKFPNTIESFESLDDLAGGPFLAKISLKNIDSDFNHLLNFGAGATGQREWVSSAELRTLIELADIFVDQIIIPKNIKILDHPIFKKIENNKDACALSLSYNIFLDNLWCAMATTLHPPKKLRKPVLKTCINPAIPFIRAVDRDICMHAAYQIEKAGFDVIGYGAGGVHVQLTGDETTEDFLIASINSGAIPPVCRKDDSLDIEAAIGDVNTPDKILQSLHLNGERKNLLDIDCQIKEVLTNV
jgi:hypothetical protein